MNSIIEAIRKKNFRMAEKLLRLFLDKHPDDVYALTQLANVLWNRCKDKDALFYANKAKELSPIYPLLNYTRGRILWSLELYAQSLKEWDIILSMQKSFVAQNGCGVKWAKSVVNDSRYYKADCLYHLFKDKEAFTLMEEHLANRKKGLESDFSKKEAIAFYKILKYSHQPVCAKDTDKGYASRIAKKRISNKLDTFENDKDWKKMSSFLMAAIKRYPKEYYLKIILSECFKKMGEKTKCLNYAKDAFLQEQYDPLVKFDYADALMVNEKWNEALQQFKEIIAMGVDYIAYSEHGEGRQWANKILRNSHKNIEAIKQVLFRSKDS